MQPGCLGSSSVFSHIFYHMHACRLAKREAEYDMQTALETCREVNPGYELLVFDNKDYEATIRRVVPDLALMYHYFEPIERADLWRYVILYETGGW